MWHERPDSGRRAEGGEKMKRCRDCKEEFYEFRTNVHDGLCTRCVVARYVALEVENKGLKQEIKQFKTLFDVHEEVERTLTRERDVAQARAERLREVLEERTRDLEEVPIHGRFIEKRAAEIYVAKLRAALKPDKDAAAGGCATGANAFVEEAADDKTNRS